MMMLRPVKAFASSALFSLFVSQALGQATADYAVGVSATVQSSPAQISLTWPADPQATSYTIYRKSPESSSWGSGTTLPATATSYVDSNVVVGTAYEYRVHKSASASGSSFSGEGYIEAGIELPLVETRGKVILLVDNTLSSSLASELARLQQDLVGEGWVIVRHDVAPSSSVVAVKSLITDDYNADPSNLKAVFLFGHIPVPYSGNFAPDGHTDHVGAWPADAYYGDMNGTWTDSSVNNADASDPRNRNVPDDGKFDQSSLPSDVELQVGRVDLGNLPAFGKSETELLRQYLNKDHNFRFKLFQALPRGVVNDHFGPFKGEAFASNGPRNFGPFFGASSITNILDWHDSLSWQSFLWGYGCGPGWYSGAGGVTDSTQLALADPQVVFTMMFGSYFGDWDSPNNLLRASLATPSYTLTSAWAGRPWWQFHHMAMGETIGFSTRLSQNNSSVYAGGQRTRGVHVALMGDPTLRMHPVAPPQGLIVATNNSGDITLRWSASPEPVLGYHVYRSASANGPFTRITSTLLNTTTFTEANGNPASTYMVRAVKLETSASGSYYNPSQGIAQTLSGSLAAARVSLRLTPTSAGAVVLSGQGMPGKAYDIEALDAASNWEHVGSVTADSSGLFRFEDSCTATMRIYRSVSR